ncbi:PAP-specific phosphatase HAL2-like protein [Cinnamomum micranthum f. kanehirae]|uniref:PAP-specific phosphatase HAL2-like protein n=1 Tax=Cinnamomum micranthum f. kanehirae TaxID=337451 RepID=A0A3S3P0Z5_9MAGN|nr:PAP-specific phosphatase HAL2-like protein [Cinnamomum micranthum f. kanehirae]
MSMHVPCGTTHATKLPVCILTSIASKRYKRPWPKDVGFPFFSGNLSSLTKLGLSEIASPFLESHQSPQMEAQMGVSIPEGEKYSKELDVAVRVVQMACCICQRVQESLIQSSNGLIKSKEDDSPVTVADWSVQATVSWVLAECFGSRNASIVAEEDVQTLSKAEAAGLLESVVNTVNECLSEAPVFGLAGPKKPLGTQEILEAIGRSLAMIEDGEVVLGVLGCPNYPMKKEWLNYHHRYYRFMSKLSPPTAESWDKGCVIYAQRGSQKAWMQPLIHDGKKVVGPNSVREIRVSSIDEPALATFCEPVEKANSSHSFTAGLAHSVGLRTATLLHLAMSSKIETGHKLGGLDSTRSRDGGISMQTSGTPRGICSRANSQCVILLLEPNPPLFMGFVRQDTMSRIALK